MINKETYKRLTETKKINEYCSTVECEGYCEDCYVEKLYERLAELEDKIENGTLIDLPCKVGDMAIAIIDTLAYDNSIEKVKIKGLAYIVEDENGDTTFQHISRIFPNKEQAEARLKELQENKK